MIEEPDHILYVAIESNGDSVIKSKMTPLDTAMALLNITMAAMERYKENQQSSIVRPA